MLRFKPQLIIFLSGLPYFLAGIMLNRKGVNFISEATSLAGELPSLTLPFVRPLTSLFGDATMAMIFLVIIALVTGVFKGRKVIVPGVERNLLRLQAQTNPIPLTQTYDRKGWIILGVMMTLGMLINNLPVPIDVRGFVDVAVGVALIQGGVASLRVYRSLKTA